MVKQRVIVYVDGFNFYYGLKRNPRWKRYYWIDFVRLFESFMKPHQELVAVKYFSAKPISNEDKAERQSLLFKANEENPKFQLVLGKYLQKSLTCKNCGYKITTYEEKESDVRIATQVVRDAFEKSCDVAIVVSADSDMKPAVELAEAAGVMVVNCFPPFQHSNALLNISHGVMRMERYERLFKQAIMPDEVVQSNGYCIRIPYKWKMMQPMP